MQSELPSQKGEQKKKKKKKTKILIRIKQMGQITGTKKGTMGITA